MHKLHGAPAGALCGRRETSTAVLRTVGRSVQEGLTMFVTNTVTRTMPQIAKRYFSRLFQLASAFEGDAGRVRAITVSSPRKDEREQLCQRMQTPSFSHSLSEKRKSRAYRRQKCFWIVAPICFLEHATSSSREMHVARLRGPARSTQRRPSPYAEFRFHRPGGGGVDVSRRS